MKLSTRVRYGARAMQELATFYGHGPVLLKDISRRQEISQKYLDSILSALRAARLVKAKRGAKGGYVLDKPPSDITLREVIEAIEGPITLVECLRDKDFCRRVKSCVMHDIWAELGSVMEDKLNQITLADLVLRQKGKSKGLQRMYYI